MRQKWQTRIFGVMLLTLGFCTICLAQESEYNLREEIEALKQGQQRISKELQEIKALLRNRTATRPSGPNVRDVEFQLGDNPILGDHKAQLTLVEFTDYQ